MNEQDLKAIIKEVVRECISEKCGKGHLAGGEKGKRMFKHIKTGYKGEKSAEDAERIAAATVNKQLGEEGKEIPKGKLAQLNPKIADKGKDRPTGKGLSPLPSPLKKANEAGALSQEGEEHDYDESEEIKLIRGLHLITKKLLDMHGNMEEYASGFEQEEGCHEEEQEETVQENGPQYKVRDGRSYVEQPGQVNRAREIQEDPLVNEKKEKWIQKAVDPKHKGFCTPMTKKTCTPRRKALAKRFKKGLEETKKIAGFLLEEYEAGPQYKVVDGRSYVEQPGQVNRARDIANEPEVNETSLHKVQTRSHTEVNAGDVAQNPDATSDPTTPMV